MNAARNTRSGFTLIELLTVIAIIGILAGLTATVLPRVLERAKIARMESVFKNLQTALAAYYTDHDSYPPAYGYLIRALDEDGNPTLIQNTQPWMAFLKSHEDFSQYDQFATNGADTDRDNAISRFEYAPLGFTTPGTNVVRFTDELFDPVNQTPSGEFNRMTNRPERPLIYVPVDSRSQSACCCGMVCRGPLPIRDPTDTEDTNGALEALVTNAAFPPPRYDSYVLISVGPAESTFGLVYSGQTNQLNLSNYNNGVMVDTTGATYDASYHVLAMPFTSWPRAMLTMEGPATDNSISISGRARVVDRRSLRRTACPIRSRPTAPAR
jgi:prepilin-type N-terminal cleavage/methylation domain-containing protein